MHRLFEPCEGFLLLCNRFRMEYKMEYFVYGDDFSRVTKSSMLRSAARIHVKNASKSEFMMATIKNTKMKIRDDK